MLKKQIIRGYVGILFLSLLAISNKVSSCELKGDSYAVGSKAMAAFNEKLKESFHQSFNKHIKEGSKERSFFWASEMTDYEGNAARLVCLPVVGHGTQWVQVYDSYVEYAGIPDDAKLVHHLPLEDNVVWIYDSRKNKYTYYNER